MYSESVNYANIAIGYPLISTAIIIISLLNKGAISELWIWLWILSFPIHNIIGIAGILVEVSSVHRNRIIT